MKSHVLYVCLAIAWPATAQAADALKFGPAPSWVSSTPLPLTPNAPAEAPIAILLTDQQIAFEPGKVTVYNETAMKVQTSQGLAAGNISFPWDPATQSVTVHKLHLRRGDQIIDVLGNGQTFTVIRRESNLEIATLDGQLTANIQPEGLQEGDIIDFALTIEHRDPIMKDRVEGQFATWNGVPVKLGHTRITWPSDLKLNIQARGDIALPKPRIVAGKNVLEISRSDLEPLIPPKGAPLRFALGRYGEASSYSSWADVAQIFLPLYQSAAVVAPSGPLRQEIDRIRSESRDPKVRAEKALQLVQERVRYVALLMGSGGYVPAPAETTWSRRFGDCKGKTALLLAILRELGIAAEPVFVHSSLGEAIPDRLPTASVFDHVLVRAHIAGTSFWLDGTRTGDRTLDSIQVPAFDWGLPLIENAKLVAIATPPLDRPNSETLVTIDASAGVLAPASTVVEQVIRGDDAEALNSVYSSLTAAQKEELLRSYWKKRYDFLTVRSTAASYDKANRQLRLTTTGEAKFDWEGGRIWLPEASIGYEPDLERAPGPLREAPFAVAFPRYEKSKLTIKLPSQFAGQPYNPAIVRETLAGVEYERTARMQGPSLIVEKSERSLVPEVSYAEAIAAEPRLRALSDQDLALRLPGNYRPSTAELAALRSGSPGSSAEYLRRGNVFMDRGDYDQAISDFTQAISLNPNDAWGYANRGMAYTWKRQYELAEKDYANTEAIQASNPVLLRGRALMAQGMGNPEKAAELYARAIQVDPDNLFALNQRANVLMALGKAAEALREYDSTLARFPRNALALAGRARIKLSQKDYAAARADILAALAIDSRSPAALSVKGELAAAEADYSTMVQVYSEILKDTPDSSYAALQRAKAYRELNEDERALEDTKLALQSSQDKAEVRLFRANIFLYQRDREKVISEAALLARENPKSDFAQVTAARIYSRLGMAKEAGLAFDRAIAIAPHAYIYVNKAQSRPWTDITGRLADLDLALKLEPNSGDALASKAWELSRKGDYEDALHAIELAIKSDATADSYRFDRISITHKAGRTEEALKLFAEERAKAKSWSDFNTLCWRKVINNVLLQSALEDCQTALKLNPTSGAVQDSLGFALLRLGRLDDALKAFDRAIADRNASNSYMGRAIVHARKGDLARAAVDRAEALKTDVDAEARLRESGLTID